MFVVLLTVVTMADGSGRKEGCSSLRNFNIQFVESLLLLMAAGLAKLSCIVSRSPGSYSPS